VGVIFVTWAYMVPDKKVEKLNGTTGGYQQKIITDK
jgi:hypothetical protein